MQEYYREPFPTHMEKKGKPKTEENQRYKKPKPNISGKERAKDIPSWAKGNRPYKGESGREFAKRLMDKRFGSQRHETGPKSDFNQLKKYGDRGFE